jgi:putative ABC transport system substrate-binding protein
MMSPRGVAADTPLKGRRIGLLMSTTPMAASHIVTAFAEGLRELGHVEGQNIVFEYRWAEGKPERFAELAADLVRQGSSSSSLPPRRRRWRPSERRRLFQS